MSIITIKQNSFKTGFVHDRRQEFLLDSVADFNLLPKDCAPGSLAYLADNSIVRRMSSSGDWVDVDEGVSKSDVDQLAEDVSNLNEDVVNLTEEIESIRDEGVMVSGTSTTKNSRLIVLDCYEDNEIVVNGETADVATLVHCGKNLLPSYTTGGTKAGVTITPNDDGTITLNGTASASAWPDICPKANPLFLPAGTYTLSAQRLGGSGGAVGVTVTPVTGSDNLAYGTTENWPETFTVATGTEVQVYFTLANGRVFEDMLVGFQIEPGTKQTAYEQHTKLAVNDLVLPASLMAYGGKNVIYTESNDVLTATAQRTAADIIAEAVKNELAIDWLSYGLPMLYMTGDTTGMSKDDAVVLRFAYKEYTGWAKVKWQGSSSIKWPKKNYTVSLYYDEACTQPMAIELVEGWGAHHKYCFKANFIDFSHARNIVSCKKWGKIVKSRGLHSTVYPNANGGDYFDYYKYVDGAFVSPHGAAVSGKGRYCINGFTVPAGRYDVAADVYVPSGGTDKQVICSLYDTANHNAYALNRPISTDTWERLYIPGIEAASFTSPCYFSIMGREIEGAKFKNIVLTNTVTKEEIMVPPPAWQIKDLPNGGAIDGFPCVVMLNDEFHGLYTWNIPKDGWMLGTPKAIVCADLHCDATKFRALATMDGDFKLEYAEDESNTDWVLPSLNRAIQAVMDGNLDTAAQYIDIQSAIDYYIHTVEESAADGTSKNYLLYTYDGVKWYFCAYDRDTTYGIYWDGKNFYSPAYASVTFAGYASNHALMNLIYTNKRADLKTRAIELRNGISSTANVVTDFNIFIKDIPSRLYDEDARKWPTIPSTSVSNLAQISSWYIIRRQIIDAEIDSWT